MPPFNTLLRSGIHWSKSLYLHQKTKTKVDIQLFSEYQFPLFFVGFRGRREH